MTCNICDLRGTHLNLSRCLLIKSSVTGVQGANRICALKGLSVDLPCSPEHPTSSINWYTGHWNGSNFVLNDFSRYGNRTIYNMSGEGNFTLTMNDLRESDANFYCCGNITDKAGYCWSHRTELRVTGTLTVSN